MSRFSVNVPLGASDQAKAGEIRCKRQAERRSEELPPSLDFGKRQAERRSEELPPSLDYC